MLKGLVLGRLRQRRQLLLLLVGVVVLSLQLVLQRWGRLLGVRQRLLQRRCGLLQQR